MTGGFLCLPRSPPPARIKETHHNDVLLGRGVVCNKHSGNKKFRALVALNKELFMSSNKRKKRSLARFIVSAVRSMKPPGRFLVKDDANSCYIDVGDAKAAEKAFQALRDASVTMKREDFPDDSSILDLVYESDRSEACAPTSLPTCLTKEQQHGPALSLSTPENVNSMIANQTRPALPRSAPPVPCVSTGSLPSPSWTQSQTPTVAKKRKYKSFRKSASMPVMQDQAIDAAMHHHAMVTPMPMHRSASADMAYGLPMPLWQAQHNPMPHLPARDVPYESHPQLAHASSIPYLNEVGATFPYQCLPHVQVPHIPAMNVNITYVPVIQYQPTITATFASPCQNPTYYMHHYDRELTTHTKMAYTEEILSDSDDNAEYNANMEASRSRLLMGEGYHSPRSSPVSSSPMRKASWQRRVPTLAYQDNPSGYDNVIEIDLCNDQPLLSQAQGACWNETDAAASLVHGGSCQIQCPSLPLAIATCTDVVNTFDSEPAISADLFEQFLFDCNVESFDECDS